MRIDCPSCGAAYQVPDAVLAARRVVRCARCAKDWTPENLPPSLGPSFSIEAEPPSIFAGAQVGSVDGDPQPGSATATVQPPGEPGAPLEQPVLQASFAPPAFLTRPLPKALPPPTARASVIYAWAASVALIAAMGASAVTWRGPVMHAWPASARLYAAMGLS